MHIHPNYGTLKSLECRAPTPFIALIAHERLKTSTPSVDLLTVDADGPFRQVSKPLPEPVFTNTCCTVVVILIVLRAMKTVMTTISLASDAPALATSFVELVARACRFTS
jgi:hypothetical protein